MAIKPKVIVLSGYGLNCEEETAHAFNVALRLSSGSTALRLSSGSTTQPQVDIVHINDLIASKNVLKKYQILAIPGGFSFGDDTGSGKAYANKLKNHLRDELFKFAETDKLIIGICNGFQILTQTGLLPGALLFNEVPRYNCRWVDLQSSPSLRKRGPGGDIKSPWLKNIKTLSLPIAHGEGKFYADKKTLKALEENSALAFKYYKGEISKTFGLIPNPNGSMLDIAAITGYNGRVLGIMPHPERSLYFTQLPHWTLLKEKLAREGKEIPKYGPGLQIFQNSINYFK